MFKSNMGIYQIRNLINGKIYIGSSQEISKRWKHHKCVLRCTTHRNRHLQNAWNKYGEESFVFELFDAVDDVDSLILVEQWYLDNWKPEYNIAKFADASMRGRKLTNKAKKKLSDARKGKGNPFFGRKHSDTTKKKISEFFLSDQNPNRGRKATDESKRRMSEKRISLEIAVGESNPNAKVTEKDVKEIRRLRETGEYKLRELSDMWGVEIAAIHKIVKYKTWRHVK